MLLFLKFLKRPRWWTGHSAALTLPCLCPCLYKHPLWLLARESEACFFSDDVTHRYRQTSWIQSHRMNYFHQIRDIMEHIWNISSTSHLQQPVFGWKLPDFASKTSGFVPAHTAWNVNPDVMSKMSSGLTLTNVDTPSQRESESPVMKIQWFHAHRCPSSILNVGLLEQTFGSFAHSNGKTLLQAVASLVQGIQWFHAFTNVKSGISNTGLLSKICGHFRFTDVKKHLDKTTSITALSCQKGISAVSRHQRSLFHAPLLLDVFNGLKWNSVTTLLSLTRHLPARRIYSSSPVSPFTV